MAGNKRRDCRDRVSTDLGTRFAKLIIAMASPSHRRHEVSPCFVSPVRRGNQKEIICIKEKSFQPAKVGIGINQDLRKTPQSGYQPVSRDLQATDCCSANGKIEKTADHIGITYFPRNHANGEA